MGSIASRAARCAVMVLPIVLAACAATPAPQTVTAGPPVVPPTTTTTLTFDCRDVQAQVLLDGTVAHLPTRACRDSSGQWQLVQNDADSPYAAMPDDADSPYPANTFLVYDPTLWGYPFFGFGANVVIFNHSHFHRHAPYFHGSGMRHRR